MRQLGAQDAQFLFADTANTFANVAMVLVFAPAAGRRDKLDFETLIEHVAGRLHASPIFRRRLQRVPLDLDYPYWVDDEHFDVEFHLQYSCLPKPGTWNQFRHFVSKYQNKPMDMNRPLWEICMVDGLDGVTGVPKGSFALIVKAHHAAVDGVSGMQFFAALVDGDEYGTPAVDITSEAERAGEAPGTAEMLARALGANVRSPIRLMDSIRRAVPDVLPLVMHRLSGGEQASTGVPDTRFNRPVSPRRHFDACWFALSDFKRMKASVEGATINDAVLAVCGGALRQYLQTLGELPDKSLVAWVPINARPKNGTAAGAGNQITAMTAPLYTNLAEPHDRLTAITRHTRRSKEAKSGMSAKMIIELSQHVPAYTIALATRLILKANATMRMCNLMVTNVPGPQVPVYLQGSKCIHQIGLTPIGDGMGLCIGTPSYNGEIAFTVISTPDMIPDTEAFIHCVKRSFRELRKACEAAGPIDSVTTTRPARSSKAMRTRVSRAAR